MVWRIFKLLQFEHGSLESFLCIVSVGMNMDVSLIFGLI